MALVVHVLVLELEIRIIHYVTEMFHYMIKLQFLRNLFNELFIPRQFWPSEQNQRS